MLWRKDVVFMRYEKMVEGNFLRRPNRFIAYIRMDGREEICHVKNTGRCRELLTPDAKVWCQDAGNAKRKTRYDLIAVQKGKRHCLDRIIKCTVNKVFNGKGDDCYEELDGVGYMVEDVIKHFVIEILKFDAKQEFTYIQGEKEESGFWKELGINFRQFIDRVDMVKEHNGLDSYIRIIDYKTGKDDTTALTFNNAMKDSAKKAIIQIFLYCNYYNYLNNSNQKIKPLIYTVQDMSKAEIRINRNPVEDFNDFNEEFMELMKSKIEEMFDKNIPFKQTTNEDNCKYCKYKDFCRK